MEPTYLAEFFNHPMTMRMRSQDLGVTSFFQGFNPAFQLPNSGKGKAREADFEAAFANAMASLNMNSENIARIVELPDNITIQENNDAKTSSNNAESVSSYDPSVQHY